MVCGAGVWCVHVPCGALVVCGGLACGDEKECLRVL